MKRIAIAISLLALSAIGYAATKYPAPSNISVLTLTQVAASTPTYIGQVVVCSNCAAQNNTLGTLCISTETTTAQNAFIVACSSAATAATCK